MRHLLLIPLTFVIGMVLDPPLTAEEKPNSKATVAELTPPGTLGRYLYMTPDSYGGGAKGVISVADIDQDYEIVKRIPLPSRGRTRGNAGSEGGTFGAGAGRLFISDNRYVECFDLLAEKPVWKTTFTKGQGGADRCCVTPDGKKVYVPEGWWSKNYQGIKILSGETGELIKTIPLGIGGMHNSIMGPTGERAYFGSIYSGTLIVVDTATDQVCARVGNFGSKNWQEEKPKLTKGRVSPFTINGSETLCFVNSPGAHLYVGDLNTGRVITPSAPIPPEPPPEGAKPRKRVFCHGIGLSPDESEAWVHDNYSQKVRVFDVLVNPPRQKASMDLCRKSHGWVGFSLDGRWAWIDTGDVFDVKTKELVGRIQTRGIGRYIEVHIRDGRVVAMGDQFGIGRSKEKREMAPAP